MAPRKHLRISGRTAGLMAAGALAAAIHLGLFGAGAAALATSGWTGWAADAALAAVAVKLLVLGRVAGRGGARRVLRAAYQRRNLGDHAPVPHRPAGGFRPGQHGGGPPPGQRGGQAAMEELLRGLSARFPGHHLEVADIAATGPPWRTVVIAWLTLTVPVPGRAAMRSTVAQRARLRWGKITCLETLPDSTELGQAIAALTTAGAADASTGT